MKRKPQPLFLAFVVLAVALVPGAARGENGGDKTLSPYFFVEGGDASVDRFPLKGTDVAVKINGVIADVLVTQRYANEGTRPINARYVFPASTRASVHGLKMTVGNQAVTARIRKRQEAKREFEKARTEGKSAALLEQQRPNVFTMNIANVMPRDEVVVEMHYTELLVPAEGTYQFVFPTVVGPRYSSQPEAGAPETDRWVKSPYLKDGKVPPGRFDIRATLSTGIPLQEVGCTSHEVDIAWDSRSVARVTQRKPQEYGGNRDFILNYRLAGKEIVSGLMLYKGPSENFFLLMVQPPERIRQADIPPREYVFILDVSGSMHGFPLDTAKVLIRDLIGNLRATDRFNLVLFSGGSRVLEPSSVPATAENVRMAIRMIDGQQGGGGTELRAAMERALSLPRDENFSRTVLVITDGYIAAERDVFDLIRDNLGSTNFFSFGIGAGVNRYLIEGMARAGRGEPFVVTKPDEAQGASARFREYVQSPVLTGIQVRFRDFDVVDVEPTAVPDVFAARPVVLLGKWRGKAAGEIEITGKSGTGDYARTFRLSDAKPLPANDALRYLWARERIARLSDFSFGKGSPEAVAEVTSLGLTYSLLTPYTSFVAVLETVRNAEGGAANVDQPLPLPLGVSNLAVGGGYAAGPEPELPLLVAIALFAVSAAAVLRGRSRRARAGAFDGRER